MHLCHLLLFSLGVFASPVELNETYLQKNQEKLVNALVDFGKDNFTWPELELTPVYNPALTVEDVDEVRREGKEPLTMDMVEDDTVSKNVKAMLGIIESNTDGAYSSVISENNRVINLPPGPNTSTPITEKPIYILHHPSNDGPSDLEKDVYYHGDGDIARPICSSFQHSVLGSDFGESTFPRVSYISTDVMPFHVHYAPDDDLRYESYKWPFSACNYACELQALKIRALFDWELDPVNEDSGLDDETKQALMVAREICQWKNVHHHFVVDDCSRGDLKRRDVKDIQVVSLDPIDFQNSSTNGRDLIRQGKSPTPAPQLFGPTGSIVEEPLPALYLSDGARAAMTEIEGIFASTKGPKDLSQMFHTVIIACQIHRYTSTPMSELEISSSQQMVQQAMSQIGRVFEETQGRIDAMETRDAIVRATQIYRYQEEQGQ
jgi:hypothetical protein